MKGAFTGAIEKRVGRFEVANGGTIFLDEIGELPPDAQVKLLRVLQEQEFEPVGSSRTVRVNVRVIAATNRNLEQAVGRDGRFRADLLYRLNVFPIEVPPLRQRNGDIPLLVGFFSPAVARLASPFRASARAAWIGWSITWPGNVRELQNVVERAAILAQGRCWRSKAISRGRQRGRRRSPVAMKPACPQTADRSTKCSGFTSWTCSRDRGRRRGRAARLRARVAPQHAAQPHEEAGHFDERLTAVVRSASSLGTNIRPDPLARRLSTKYRSSVVAAGDLLRPPATIFRGRYVRPMWRPFDSNSIIYKSNTEVVTDG